MSKAIWLATSHSEPSDDRHFEKSYEASPFRESAKFKVTKGDSLKAASPMVRTHTASPCYKGVMLTYNYGCELVSFFFVTGIAEPSDGERKKAHTFCVNVISNFQIKTDMEYRIYNRINCTLFDMVGHHEPDQTKSLGYILAKSVEAMKMFLSLIQINKRQIAFLTSLKWVIECEERIVPGNVKSKRTDIVIRFYDKKNVIQNMIIIEAKGIKTHANPQQLINQLQSYKTIYSALYASTQNIMYVTLTNIRINHSSLISNGIYSLTWLGIIGKFHQFAAKSKTKTHEVQLISDFVNYLVNI